MSGSTAPPVENDPTIPPPAPADDQQQGTFWQGADVGFSPSDYPATSGALPAPTADAIAGAFGAAWRDNPSVSLYRWFQRQRADQVARNHMPGASAWLTPEEANERYGINGDLNFDRPISEDSARQLHETHRQDSIRKDVVERSSGIAAGTGRAVLSLAAAALDPLNIGSMFIPVVGQTREAAWLAQGASRLARIAAAGRVGAVEGAAGAAMLEPLNYGLAQSEQRDYGITDSLYAIAGGAILGAGAHGLLRAGIDIYNKWAPDIPRQAVIDTHNTAMQVAAAQLERGDPVNVEPVIAAGRLYGESLRDRLMTSAAVQPPDPAWRLPTVEELRRSPPDNPLLFKRDGNGERYLRGPNGTPELARLPELAGQPEMPVLVRRGDIKHLNTVAKRAEAVDAGHPDGLARAYDTLQNWTEARLGHDNRPVLVRRDRDGHPVAVVELGREGDHWRMVTQGDRRGEQLEEMELLATRERTPGTGTGVLTPFLRPQSSMPVTGNVFAQGRSSGSYVFGPDPAFNRQDPEAVRAMITDAARQAMRPDDAAALRRAQAARVRSDAGSRDESPLGKVNAQVAALDQRIQSTDALLRQQVAAGRMTEAEAEAVRDAPGEAITQERAKGLEAGAACIISRGL